MSDRVKLPPALKHAAYSAMALLPDEDPKAFEKLHRDLIADLRPDGATEMDVVATIARLMWRKQNYEVVRKAEALKDRVSAIRSSLAYGYDSSADDYARSRARQELEEAYEFIEMGNAATVDGLLKDLDVQQRLDGAIDRCLNVCCS